MAWLNWGYNPLSWVFLLAHYFVEELFLTWNKEYLRAKVDLPGKEDAEW